MRDYYVYIITNESGTLYTGVTNDLERRACGHKEKLLEGFTKKYNITRLLHYEVIPDIRDAIAREKQIKSWRRSKKLALIHSLKPRWRDLAEEWYSQPAALADGVRPLAALGVTGSAMGLESNALYYGDNLDILRDRIPDEATDLILNGKRPEMPPQRSPFAEAPVERGQAKTKRLL